MTPYQQPEGELSQAQHADSIALAEVLTETVPSLQDGSWPAYSHLALDNVVQYRAETYQASSMAAIQLSIPSAVALLRTHAHAFASDQSVAESAVDIVARRLRLPNDQPETEV